MEDELEEQMRREETLEMESKHGDGWKVVNEISGRNSNKKGILEGGSKEERVKIKTGFIIFRHF